MTPGFAARRRAEEFNALVEGTSTEGPGSRHGDTLALIESLRRIEPVEPRAEFVLDLRRQLMTEAATVLTPTAARLTVVPQRTSRERRIAVAIGGFAVISATTSMAMAAQTALPGETLYPLKRALENASTTVIMDEDAKGTSLLTHASGRLDEVDALTRQSDEADARAVADTLHAFTEQASSAADLMIASYADSGQRSDIEELRSFTAQSMSTLDNLETAVPDTARAALIEAAQVISQIDAEAIKLCPSCGDGAAQLPEFLITSVDSVLGDLGSALAGATPTTAPSKTPGGERPKGIGSSHQGTGEEPGPDDSGVDTPDPSTGPGPGQNGAGDGRSDGGDGDGDDRRGRGGVIDTLTDRLTDGRSPDNNQGTLGDVLNGAVDGLVNNLLGD